MVSFMLLPSQKVKAQKPFIPVIKTIVIFCASLGAFVYGFVQLQAIYAFQAEKLL
jgi:hypothetical protein